MNILNKENEGAKLVDDLYRSVMAGVPQISEPVEELAGSYLAHYPNDREMAIEQFVQNQKLKCSAAGFVTGLGGAITLPITLSVDLASSLYVELRMIAGIACMRGYNLKDDAVKTAMLLCMVGNSMGHYVKQAGVKIAGRLTLKTLKTKLTRDVILKINRMIGFRLVTKAGSKSIISLTKLLPVVGGAVGATFNWYEVDMYAKMAKCMFA